MKIGLTCCATCGAPSVDPDVERLRREWEAIRKETTALKQRADRALEQLQKALK